MSFVNQVILIGNVGKEPEIRKVTDKGKFVHVSLATTEKYHNAQGKVCEDTQWHTVYFNNKLGNAIVEYVQKGDKIFVSGRLVSRDWQDDQGVKHTETAVYAKTLRFFSKKSGTGKQTGEQALEASEIIEDTNLEDTI